MRLHSREQVVVDTRLAIQEAIYNVLGDYDLTNAETVKVMHEVFEQTLNSYIRNEIRMERHGTYDKSEAME